MTPDLTKILGPLSRPDPAIGSLGDHLANIETKMDLMQKTIELLYRLVVANQRKYEVTTIESGAQTVEVVENSVDLETASAATTKTGVEIIDVERVDVLEVSEPPTVENSESNLDDAEGNREYIDVNMKAQMKQKPKKSRSKMQTMMLGDSILHNINTREVEKEIGGLLFTPGLYGSGARTNRCYGAKFEDGPEVKYKHNNFKNKVPKLLKERPVDNLILQAPSVDITNLKLQTNNEEFNINKAKESSEVMVEVACDALENNKDMKIVILERTPRYDDKADLSEFSNFVLQELVRKAKHKYGDRLMYGSHILDSEGTTREARYGRPGVTPRYDGLHLRGVLGKQAYTNSVINILSEAGVSSHGWKMVRRRKASSSRFDEQKQRSSVIVSNKFAPLN